MTRQQVDGFSASDMMHQSIKPHALMNSRMQLIAGLVLLGLASGCVTSSPPADRTGVSAYSVGDRGRVMFDEVVVSLRLRGANAPYQNLHVVPAALVNPRQTASSSSYESPYQAEQILRRLEVRVAAQLSQMLCGLGEQSLEDTGTLRQKILAEAQSVVDEALRQWKHGPEYRVEIVIASLYWTDSSVGRPRQQKAWWD
jgi:hypothetical protein